MKIGIISDIHSNIYAFKACTEFMEKQNCDEYLFLGDYISDTPYLLSRITGEQQGTFAVE